MTTLQALPLPSNFEDLCELFLLYIAYSTLGWCGEMLYCSIPKGHICEKRGFLNGFLCPIYGHGALLVLYLLHGGFQNPVLTFIFGAIVTSILEYFTSWIMEFSFGIRAWDYSGTFLSIDGRTNFVFMVMWGVLGVAWIRLLLPQLLKLINLIPWNWRYGVTAVCAALMLLDGVMTIQSIDCWYGRMAGKAPDTPIERFYAEHFDNDYMQNRFQTMTMDVDDATRIGR